MNETNTLSMIKKFYCHLRGNRLLISLILILGLVSSAVSMITPLLSKTFVDEVVGNHNYALVSSVVAALFALAVFDIVIGTAKRMIHLKLSTRILVGMRERMFSQCLKSPLEHLERYRHGDLMNRFGADIPKVQVLLVDGVIGFTQNILFLVVAAIVLLNLSISLAVLSFAGLSVALVITALFRKPIEEGTRRIREAMVEVSHFLSERLNFLRAIRLHSAQGEDQRQFSKINTNLTKELLKFQVVDSAASGFPGLTLSMNLACIYLLGGRLLESGEITLGTFVAFMLYQGRLTGPALGLLGLVRSVQEAKISLKRVSEVLVDEELKTAEIVKSHGEDVIIFNNVTFAYPGKDPVLHNVNLRIREGERVALFGASGAGKSTLVQLLFGLRLPKMGDISLIDSKYHTSYDHGDGYCRRLGYAGSEPFLIHATIAENIQYGNLRGSFEEMVEAAKIAEAHDFIMNLSNGYETIIGGRGTALSDGQRQRIGLARLFFKNAHIMVFDEVFSGLDPDTEGRIRSNMYAKFPNSTILFISHRLHALHEFNRLFLIENTHIRQVVENTLIEHMLVTNNFPSHFVELHAA